MYCINCGVQLAAHETVCPLCKTRVTNPEFIKPEAPTPYPKHHDNSSEMSRSGVLFVLTFMFLIPILLTAICDLSINGQIVWSGFTVGALVLGYLVVVLPLWFKSPNPVVFVSLDFAWVMAFMYYINNAVGGKWFFTFAWPVIFLISLNVCAVVALLRYIKSGILYIFGGSLIFLGLTAVVTEILVNLTFYNRNSLVWSVYPLIVFVLTGIMLIIIASCKSMRESLRRKFFI